jgi:hypothetical protein
MATFIFNGETNADATGLPIIGFAFKHQDGTVHYTYPTSPATQFNPGDATNHTCADAQCIRYCQNDPRFTQTS